MKKIEEFIDKLEDNIRWWKRAMETDGFESDEEGSYRRDLENTKKELFNLISDELDKAREEGFKVGYQEAKEGVVAVDDLQMTYEWLKDVDTSNWI